MTAPTLRKIVYVEDERDIQTIAKLALEKLGGFAVEICSSGEEALRRAPALSPDLIMLDLMMPGMDGRATLKALRELPMFADTPVIFLTGKVQAQEIAQLERLGAIRVLAKPFDPMSLADEVRDAWRQYHER
jgi:two-component system, OmpR family, response regulator